MEIKIAGRNNFTSLRYHCISIIEIRQNFSNYRKDGSNPGNRFSFSACIENFNISKQTYEWTTFVNNRIHTVDGEV